MEKILEDSKVIGSAGLALGLEYAQILNSFLSLLISICTLIYVGKRAYQIVSDWLNGERHD